MKNKLEEYTEQEFLEFIDKISVNPGNLSSKAFEKYTISMVEHFKRITEHPAASDVIFWPAPGQEDSSAGILKTIKDWRAQNGKPGFKAPDEDSLIS